MKSFSLIEVVMTLVILAILAAVALPKFVSLRDEAEKSTEKATVAAIQEGLHLYHLSQIVE